MLDHLGRRQRAEPRRGAVVLAARQADQEAGREQIAGAGDVDHRSIGIAGTASAPLRVTTTQPFSLRVTTASLASPRSAFTAVSKSAVS